MITNLGKNVLAKYLIGQSPSYASHIAVGCGAKPLKQLSVIITSAVKTSITGGYQVTATTFDDHGLYPGLTLDIDTGNSNYSINSAVIQSVPTSTTFVYNMPTGTTGSQSFTSASAVVNFESNNSLSFEMFRVPIVSRGYVKEDGITKIVLTAEMPTQERYEITELGLYSAGSNPSATGFDSRTLYTFSRQEQWKTIEVSNGIETQSDMYIIDSPLDADISTGDFADISSVSGDQQDHKAFQTNATNRIFSNEYRKLRGEQLRYLNNMVLLRGDYSSLVSTQNPTISTSSSYISLPTSANLQKNSSSDIVKMAFSVVNVSNTVGVDGYPTQNPHKASVVVRFVDSSGAYAQATFDSPSGHNWKNRYLVISKQLSEFSISSGFNWSRVVKVNVYGGVYLDSTTLSEDFYIGLDAIRLENITSENPLYGLTGYSILVTDDQLPIVKLPNTSSLVEFRLGIGV